MRLIMGFLLLVLITGCSSPNTESADVKEENNREVTEEEQQYIQLILDKEYDTVLKQTRGKDDKLATNYYNIAYSLENYQEVSSYDGDYSDVKYKMEYYVVVKGLEKVEYIPDELKEQIELVESDSTRKYEYYLNKVDEESKKQNDLKKGISPTDNEKERLIKEVDYRTQNPQTVSIGMTKNEVLTEGWGRPNDINKTTTAYGTSEQWVYEGYNYLYFDDGILTSIQN